VSELPDKPATFRAMIVWAIVVTVLAIIFATRIPVWVLVLLRQLPSDSLWLWATTTLLTIGIAGLFASSLCVRPSGMKVGIVAGILAALWLLGIQTSDGGVAVAPVHVALVLLFLGVVSPGIWAAQAKPLVAFIIGLVLSSIQVCLVLLGYYALIDGPGWVQEAGRVSGAGLWFCICILVVANATSRALPDAQQGRYVVVRFGKVRTLHRQEVLWRTPRDTSPMILVVTSSGFYPLLGPKPGTIAPGGGGWDVLRWLDSPNQIPSTGRCDQHSNDECN